MSEAGRLARGKANFEAKKFLDNSETLAYIDSLPKVKEAKKDAKPSK